jgi:hypothetical protein
MRSQFGLCLFEVQHAQISEPDGNIARRPMTVLVLRHLPENGFRFSPDSSAVLYVADQDTDEVDELFSVTTGEPSNPIFANGFE